MSFKNWLLEAWPILLSLLIGYLHYLVVTNFNVNVSEINKIASLVLQIIGGLFIIYSIDSNIGIVINKSIYKLVKKWFISMPLFSKSVVVPAATGKIEVGGSASAKARGTASNETIEGKIEYLQQQINWLKEDLNDEVKSIKNLHDKSEKAFNIKIKNLTGLISETDTKLNKISLGGIKLQIFGIFLMIHGSISSFYA